MYYSVSAFFKQQIVTKLIAGMTLGLWLLPAIGLAADDDEAPVGGRSSGGRGCGTTTIVANADVPALILLTPNGQTGQTVSTRPTFAWFVRDTASVPIEFRLYEQQTDRYVLVKEMKGDRMRSTAGITVLSAAVGLPALTVGKRYRWQVELVCNPNRPSSNLFAAAVLDVVPLQASLKAQLAHTRDRLEQAKLYTQADLWYDVLKTAFTTAANSPTSRTTNRTTTNSATDLQALRRSLLDQVAIDPAERKLLNASVIHAIRR